MQNSLCEAPLTDPVCRSLAVGINKRPSFATFHTDDYSFIMHLSMLSRGGGGGRGGGE